MDQLCVRCTRQALATSAVARRHVFRVATRSLSNSSTSQAVFDLSKPLPGDDSAAKSPTRPASASQDRQARSSDKPSVLVRKTPTSSTPRIDKPTVVVRKTQTTSTPRTLFGRPLDSSPKVLTLKRPANSDGANGRVVSRTGLPRSDSPGGASGARRSGPPRGGLGARGGPPSQGPRRGRGGGFGAGGAAGRLGPRGGSGRGSREEDEIADAIKAERRGAQQKTRQNEIEEVQDLGAIQWADHMNANLNNGLPLEPIPYVPADPTVEELRKDWPDTPLSAAGLTEGVIQKLNFLARDLPHDYWTPKQIAERLVDGGLVKFEDEEHKQKVLKYAEEWLAERKADEAAFQSRRGDPNPAEGPATMDSWTTTGFVSVSGREEGTQSVIDASVKGNYPELPQGQRPLYTSLLRQLRNNESYGASDTAKFFGRVQRLIANVQKQNTATRSVQRQ